MTTNQIITNYYCANCPHRANETNVQQLIAEIQREGRGPTQEEFWRIISSMGGRVAPTTWGL